MSYILTDVRNLHIIVLLILHHGATSPKLTKLRFFKIVGHDQSDFSLGYGLINRQLSQNVCKPLTDF